MLPEITDILNMFLSAKLRFPSRMSEGSSCDRQDAGRDRGRDDTWKNCKDLLESGGSGKGSDGGGGGTGPQEPGRERPGKEHQPPLGR